MGLLKRFMGVKEGTGVKHGSMWSDFFGDVDRVDKTIEIEYNRYAGFVLHLTKGETPHIIIDVIKGGEIDIITVDSQDWENWKAGRSFNYYPEATSFRTRHQDFRVKAVDEDNYYVIVDNSQMPYDGAEPNILENQGRVEVRIRAVSAKPLYQKRDSWLEGEGVVEKKKTFSGV